MGVRLKLDENGERWPDNTHPGRANAGMFFSTGTNGHLMIIKPLAPIRVVMNIGQRWQTGYARSTVMRQSWGSGSLSTINRQPSGHLGIFKRFASV
jgi:hypothetical protein